MAASDRTAAEAALEPSSPAARRVGWGFISLYTLAYMSTNLLFLAPLLVTLALKVDALVGNQRAPASLALVAAVGKRSDHAHHRRDADAAGDQHMHVGRVSDGERPIGSIKIDTLPHGHVRKARHPDRAGL